MDICFIVDTSVSVDATEWDDLRQFMEDVILSIEKVGSATDETRIGYLTYSGYTEMSGYLDQYTTKQEAIDGILRSEIIPVLSGVGSRRSGLRIANRSPAAASQSLRASRSFRGSIRCSA